MNRVVNILLLTAAFGLTGCLSTLRVTHGGTPPSANSHVDGVPFYVKKAACRHETIWAEPVYKLTLQQADPTKAEATSKSGVAFKDVDVATLNQSVLDSEQMRTLIRAINDGTATLDTFKAVKDALCDKGTPKRCKRPGSEFPETSERFAIANTNKAVPYVAYDDPYYYNVNRPWIGSSKADIKLSSDGTINEASAEVDSKTLQSILDVIPIKDTLSALVKAGGVGLVSTSAGAVFQLKIEKTTYLHNLTETRELGQSSQNSGLCSQPSTKLEDPNSVEYLRTEATQGVAADGDQQGSQVKFSGKVILPTDTKKDNPEK